MEVEWLILADAAQVAGGKLNMLGGGWDVLTVNDEWPHKQQVAIAVAFTVPWNETNQAHAVYIAIIAEEGQSEILRVDAQLEVGRPVGILQGQAQRAQVAIEGIIELQAGMYDVVTGVQNGGEKHISFRVVPGPNLGNQPRL